MLGLVAVLSILLTVPALASYREVDRWPMNEASGSGNLSGVMGHNGKRFNVLKVPSPCLSVTCFRFNGTNAWARISDFSDLDHTTASKEYGVLIWWQRIAAAPLGSADKLFLRGTPKTSIGWELEQRTANNGQVRVCFSVRGSIGAALGVCSQPLSQSGLHDIQGWVVPSSGAPGSVSTVQMWVNHQLHASVVAEIGTIITNKGLTICRSPGQATGWCHGHMDEIKILKEQ